MKQVYVKGYDGAGFGGRFIKWFSFSLYPPTSHVSNIYEIDGEPIEYQSIQGKGVFVQLFDPDAGGGQLYYRDVSDEDFELMLAAAQSVVGAKYDWSGIWGFIRRKIKERADKWFCSEYTAWQFHKGNNRLSRKKAFQHTPGDVVTSMVITPCDVPEHWRN
jgi:hypothetical protein